MRIGELARFSGTSPRMLRYYESLGLLTSKRDLNGYRSFNKSDIERARTISELIQSGLSTKLIRISLISAERSTEWTMTCNAELATLLRGELRALEGKITCLTRSRDAVRSYLDDVLDVLDVREA